MDVKVIVLVIGISTLTVALLVVLKSLQSMINLNMQVQNNIPQSGKAFVEREVGIGKTDI